MTRFLYTAIIVLFSIGLNAQDLIPLIQIQGEQDVSPYENQEVSFNARVTNAFGDYWYMQDEYGAWNGILVLEDDLLVPVNPPWWTEPRQPEVGDELTLTGTVVEVDGNTQLIDVVLVEQTEFWMATAAGVEVNALGTQDESLEGTRVRLVSMTVSSTANDQDEWNVTDVSGEVTIIGIDDEAIPAIGDVYDVYGSVREFNGIYKVEVSDIDVISLGVEDIEESQFNAFPNPVEDYSMVTSEEFIQSFEIRDLSGKLLLSNEVRAHSFAIERSNFANGAYVLSVQLNNQVISEMISFK